MSKITFLGAGSTVFVKNILGDVLLTPALQESHIALYDIDATRLKESYAVVDTLNKNLNAGRAHITTHLGVDQRREALRGANYAVNAIQVGGYRPAGLTDFEIPKKYGLRQTIGDTLGIGGIFRALRTIPVMLDIAADMEKVCPHAWLLNYTNPMAMVTGAVLRYSGARCVGLCHSIQVLASTILSEVGMLERVKKLRWEAAGINHQAWLLSVSDGDDDLYPEIKRRALELNQKARGTGAQKHKDMVRLEMLRHFGYYFTESSEHSAEYLPYWIKSKYPGLIEEFNIPLDEYPRRNEKRIARWKELSRTLVGNPELSHVRTEEYGSYIMEAMETNDTTRIHGNIMNTGLIANLPTKACVEVPCLVDANGVHGCFVGDLPEQCAALNRTNINVQLLTIDAAVSRNRDRVYQAAMLDPHTASELTLDEIRNLCDDLFAAHGDLIPPFE